jgi:hypothetical protein
MLGKATQSQKGRISLRDFKGTGVEWLTTEVLLRRLNLIQAS